MLWVIFYNLFIGAFLVAIRLAAIWGNKPRKWIAGRKDWENKLQKNLQSIGHPSKNKLVWLHASSVGEFEQGKPILKALKAKNPDLLAVVSFFSPSGYEANEHDPVADLVCYLPADTPRNARRFIDILKPDLVIWVKYEYWYHFLSTLHKKAIPTLLVSAIFLKNQIFFKWYGILHRKMLEFFTHLFLQNEDSAANLRSLLDPNSISVAGDTRFDRVLEIAQSFTPIPEIEAWLENAEKIMVAGSTWPEDEKMIASLKNRLNNLTLIIAPHHVDEASLQKTDLIFPGSIRMSRLLKNEPQPKSQIMIADTIGHLSKLYHYATLSYVGGGFSSTGIHNILEPAVYSKPVIFGPKYQKYAEAAGLIQAGGGFSVKTADEFEIQVKILLKAEDLYHKTALEAGRFIFDHAGATRTVTEYIYINRLLTK